MLLTLTKYMAMMIYRFGWLSWAVENPLLNNYFWSSWTTMILVDDQIYWSSTIPVHRKGFPEVFFFFKSLFYKQCFIKIFLSFIFHQPFYHHIKYKISEACRGIGIIQKMHWFSSQVLAINYLCYLQSPIFLMAIIYYYTGPT